MTAGKPPKRRRGLPDADQALWDIVASSIEPVSGKERVLDVETPEAMPPIFTRSRGLAGAAKRSQHGMDRTAAPGQGPEAGGKAKLPPPEPLPVVLERKRARRIARGAEEIEARLDLHGMTQDDAHDALTGFIRRCHSAGFRTVLVITGKGGVGGRRRQDDDDSPPKHWQDHGEHRPRGVLKRNVPMWLASPGIAALVVSFSTAHVRHGGEGALYVQLRVKR